MPLRSRPKDHKTVKQTVKSKFGLTTRTDSELLSSERTSPIPLLGHASDRWTGSERCPALPESFRGIIHPVAERFEEWDKDLTLVRAAARELSVAELKPYPIG